MDYINLEIFCLKGNSLCEINLWSNLMVRVYIVAFCCLFLSSFGLASSSGNSIQDIVRSKYGTCYKTIGDAIGGCNALTCVYPDFSNLKIWRANSIRGNQGNNCYVIYYSYLGDQIIGNYLDCYYTPEQRSALSNLYASLFSTEMAIEMASNETQINSINQIACKIRNDSSAAK